MSTVAMDPRVRARRVDVLRHRGRRRLRLLLAVAVAVGLAAAGVGLTRSPLLDVDAVVVEGTRRTAPADVVERAGVQPGAALVGLDLTEARRAITSLPWVKSVTSRRSWGGTITFEIVERRPVAAVAGTDAWLLTDEEGRVVEAVANVPPSVVTIDGARVDARPGQWIPPGQVLDAVAVATGLPDGLRDRVERLIAGPTVELELTEGGRVRVGRPDDLEDKYVAALTVLTRVPTTCLEVVDVQVPTAPVLTRNPTCS